MIVIVVVVLGVVIVRGFVSKDLDQGRPKAVEYLESVEGLQANGFDVVYPPTLPDGWIVSNVDFTPGERATYGLNFYTADDKFVGLRQEDASVDDLLEEFVDATTVSEDPLIGVGSVAPEWEGWSDEGGDRAFTTESGENTVVVFGDVSAAELTELVALLTTVPVPTSSSTP